MRKQDLIQGVRTVTGAQLKFAGVAMATMLAACGGGSTTNNCHYLATATGVVGQTSFSTALSNQGTTPSASTVSTPTGSAAATTSGMFFVADTGNNRVLAYASVPSGVGTAAAVFAIGQSGLASNSGPTSSTISGSVLSGPTKVSVSDDGTTLVVTDTGDNRILLYTPVPTQTGATPSVIVGQASATTSSSSNGCSGTAACATSLFNPTAAMIAKGKLFVVDQNDNRTLIWNTVPTANGTAADVVLGEPDMTTTTVNSTGQQTYNPNNQTILMHNPTDVWTDGKFLYVSDTGNNRVLFWNQVPQSNDVTATGLMGQIMISTSTPQASAQAMNGPTGVFADTTSGNVYIADTNNHRVLVFQNTSQPLGGATATGVFGQQDFSHDSYNDPDQNDQPGDQYNQPNTNLGPFNDTFHSPNGVYATAGNVFVSDTSNNRLMIFTESSVVDGTNANLCQ